MLWFKGVGKVLLGSKQPCGGAACLPYPNDFAGVASGPELPFVQCATNDRIEPKVPNAARCANVGFGNFQLIHKWQVADVVPHRSYRPQDVAELRDRNDNPSVSLPRHLRCAGSPTNLLLQRLPMQGRV